eukprot:6141900-Karenia_brevis.AAC.1
MFWDKKGVQFATALKNSQGESKETPGFKGLKPRQPYKSEKQYSGSATNCNTAKANALNPE